MSSSIEHAVPIKTAIITRRIEETLSRLIERSDRRETERLPGLRGAKKPTEEVMIRAAA
jgi:hypothetical protein